MKHKIGITKIEIGLIGNEGFKSLSKINDKDLNFESETKTNEVIVSIKLKGKSFARPVIIFKKEYRLNFYSKGIKALTIY